MLKEYQDLVIKNDTFEDSFKGDLLALLALQSSLGSICETQIMKSSSEIPFERAQKFKFEELTNLLEALTRYSIRIGFDLDALMKYYISNSGSSITNGK